MKERVVITFIAIALGLFITTTAFYIYQSTKKVPEENLQSAIVTKPPSPTPQSKLYLMLDEPKNESIVDRRTLQIKGKTNPGNTIIVSTNLEDIVANPTTEGNFSVTIGIDVEANKLVTRAIAPNGDEVKDERVVTFTTEEF